MQISAFVQDDSIKLPAGVHLPDGTNVSVVVDEEAEESPGALPPDYFERVAGALAGESFERPDQGDFEKRTGW